MNRVRTHRSLFAAGTFCVATLLAACSGGGGAPPAAVVVPSTRPSALAAGSPSATFRVEGVANAKFAAVDAAVEHWMAQTGARAAQAAVGQGGRIVFSHAYTMSADPSYPTTATTDVMRLASLSKIGATATANRLIASGALSAATPVFPLLGIAQPLLTSQRSDPRANAITVGELIDHTAGFTGANDPADPVFTMRDIERSIGTEPLSKMQFARYVYGLPLHSTPGTQAVYDNVGYVLLGMVVERVTGVPFDAVLQGAVLRPLGIQTFQESHTAFAARQSDETIPDDKYSGPSVFDLSPAPAQLPWSYGGGGVIFEDADSAIGYSANAEALVKLIAAYNVYYQSGAPVGRNAGYWRDGCLPGVASFAESRLDGLDWAVNFNTRPPCLDTSSAVVQSIDASLGPTGAMSTSARRRGGGDEMPGIVNGVPGGSAR